MNLRSGRARIFCLFSTMIILSFTVLQMYGPLPSLHLMDSIMSRFTLLRDDYDTLIDLPDFHFDIFENVCSDDPFLLILVISPPDHFERRETIRATWGQKTHLVRTAFMLGAADPDDTSMRTQLMLENRQHRDLVQGNFLDSYRNLTYKHVMALKYVTYHCPKAGFVLKADDDVFVNIYTLIDLLEEKLSSEKDLIFCKIKDTSPVIRTPSWKWATTEEEYPGEFFPPFCWGFAVVYSPTAMSKLYKSAQRTKYFWIDDIHVTGTLAKMNNLTRLEASDYVFSAKEVTQIPDGARVDKKFLFGYNLEEEMMQELWRTI